ncbi:PTS sugar transporter subunit IIB [Pelosinus sp. sgz500959]|uniref:PTS sugar transporter subunit IIB n=1 Tax=Pelosinus sp. sgz500959 TaxID=3242472 RepID=UPI0036702F31
MKILLVCSAGMSTSLVVEKMKKALTPEEASSVIHAIAAENFEDEFSEYDVVLLGPQLKFRKGDLGKIAATKGIPLDVINMMDYGTLQGAKILDFARKLYQSKN